ncbi:putative ribonuclease h protein [Nicotiana attenuata]|uniref:Ribonuclease h protein n=1 Tax=Nicotiana attenuata TaxID=49451 RepID=A0A1J6ILV9_NICAT|nr:putative ribonuclease h protein [Nicotiana attenuata]
MVMEYLSRILKRMSQLPDFRYHPMCKEQQLTGLTFADDLMMFCKGNEAAKLLDITGYSSGTFPMRYLGLPLSPKRWSKMDCHQLCVKITEKLNTISNIHLSYAWRLQVVVSVLISLHNFWGAVFIFPQSVLKEVDKKCRDFLWGSTSEKKKIPLVAWDKVYRPKNQGGQNIKNYKLWNIASVGKLIWLLINKKEVLWVKWIHDIYMRANGDLWTHQPTQDSRWYWRKLHGIKQQMQGWYKNGSYCLTSNGRNSISMGCNQLVGESLKWNTADLILEQNYVAQAQIHTMAGYAEEAINERQNHQNGNSLCRWNISYTVRGQKGRGEEVKEWMRVHITQHDDLPGTLMKIKRRK